MDRLPPSAGSVRRARERAQAGLPREPPSYRRPQVMDDASDMDYTTTPLRPMPQQPAASRSRRQRAPQQQENKAGHNISRPTQVPQWPLPGPMQSPTSPAGSPYRPPPGRPQQAPQRPPRPSRVPSLVDESRLQESTPVFVTQSIPEITHDTSPEYVATTPVTASSSSRLTSSSVGTIPDFPAPVTDGPAIPPRKSFNLGPPPSSRRGASSFYSAASFVSPIPEESPRSRSHGSYASSAAMPDAWRPVSPMTSPGHPEAFYDESMTDKSRDSIYDEYGDESKLVRSASLGKKAKAALVDNKPVGSTSSQPAPRPAPSPLPTFDDDTAYMDVSTSSSNTLPTPRPTPVTTPAATHSPAMARDGILGAAVAVSSPLSHGDSSNGEPSSRQFNRLSAIRRPPKLDIDAVRTAEARGSLTSLPDLIRRATRLAAMIEGGKRPASRFEDFSEYLNEKGGRDGNKEMSSE